LQDCSIGNGDLCTVRPVGVYTVEKNSILSANMHCHVKVKVNFDLILTKKLLSLEPNCIFDELANIFLAVYRSLETLFLTWDTQEHTLWTRWLGLIQLSPILVFRILVRECARTPWMGQPYWGRRGRIPEARTRGDSRAQTREERRREETTRGQGWRPLHGFVMPTCTA
jgi:hypothetical protein